jgi:integrase
MPHAKIEPEPDQLLLFESMGVDVGKLRSELRGLAAATLSPRTVAAYEDDWRDFRGWCAAAGRKALPASVETVCLYATGCIAAGRRVSTVERRVAGVAAMHRRSGHPVPVGAEVRAVLVGARRKLREVPKRKAVITPEQLRAMSAALAAVGSVRAMRDRAVLVLGFASGMRRSELSGLRLADVLFVDQGVRLTLRQSKTDQEGRGRVVGVWAGRHAQSCPVRVLRAWLRRRGRAEGPLFCVVTREDAAVVGRAMAPRDVGEAVQRAAGLVGLDPAKYGGHSLRASCITAAVEAGASELAIMQRTGHKSVQTLARYVRPASAFRVDPLRKAL